MKSTGTVADICSLQWHNLSGLEKYYRFKTLIDAKATCRRFVGILGVNLHIVVTISLFIFWLNRKYKPVCIIVYNNSTDNLKRECTCTPLCTHSHPEMAPRCCLDI